MTEIVVPDNLRSGVKKPCRYEPEFNPTCRDLAVHYSTAVMPARVRRPRDKAKVEVGVQVVQRWILVPLRPATHENLRGAACYGSSEAEVAPCLTPVSLTRGPQRSAPGGVARDRFKAIVPGLHCGFTAPAKARADLQPALLTH